MSETKSEATETETANVATKTVKETPESNTVEATAPVKFTKTKKIEKLGGKFSYLEDDLLILAEEKEASFAKLSKESQDGESGMKYTREIEMLKSMAALVKGLGTEFLSNYDLPYVPVFVEETPEVKA